MGWRGTLVMVGILAGLGYLLWAGGGEPGDDPALTESVLRGRRLLDAQRIALVRAPDQPEVVVERQDDRSWWIVEPVRDLGAEARLESIAKVYDTARAIQQYEGDAITREILEDTGLARPRARLRAEYRDGTVVLVEIGAQGVMLEDVYARLGDVIYRVQQSLHSVLQINAESLREPFVFQNTGPQVLGLRIERAAESGVREVFELRSGPGGAFELVRPNNVRVDQAVVSRLISNVVSLRATGFLRGRPRDDVGPAAPDRLAEAVVELEGTLGPEKVVLNRLEDGAMIGHVESGRRDVWFTCDPVQYRSVLTLSLDQLRARWLLPFSIDDAVKLRIDPGSGRGVALQLERSGFDAYRIAQPIQGKAQPTSVSELLTGFRSLFSRSFVADDAAPEDLLEYGLDDGAVRVSVFDDPRGRPQVLLFGADVGEEDTFAKRADEPVVVTVPRAVADLIRRPWLAYADRTVLSISQPAIVRSIAASGPDGARVYERSDDDGKWRLEGSPAPLVHVADVVEDVLADPGLTAKEVLDPTAFGLDALPRAELALADASGQVRYRLTLHRRADGRVLASVADRALCYLLSARDGDDLWSLQE